MTITTDEAKRKTVLAEYFRAAVVCDGDNVSAGQLALDIDAMADEIVRSRAVEERLLAMHAPVHEVAGESDWCRACPLETYPCPTIRILRGTDE